MQPLGFLSVFAGALLLIAGVTGSSVASVAQGAPDHAKASGPTSSASSSPSSSGELAGAIATSSATSSSAWRSTQAAIAKQRGWNLVDWNAVIQRESGGNPNSRNASSGAYGIGQFLGSTAQEYAPYGALSPNPVLQIKAMARYIGDRYGTPTMALAHERAYGWY